MPAAPFAHSTQRQPTKAPGVVNDLVPFDAESTPMYNPTSEQAEIDRQSAYEAGVPHGEPAVNPALTCTHSARKHVRLQACMASMFQNV